MMKSTSQLGDVHIQKFKELYINKKKRYFNVFSLSHEERERYEKRLKEQGFFNGDILCCEDYLINKRKLKMECIAMKFFDYYLGRIKKKKIPWSVAVNAIIEVEEGVILTNRGDNVYCYKNYWDVPAGLVPFDVGLKDRLINRVNVDTGLSEKQIKYDEKPSFLVVKEEFFLLYYKAKCLISKERVKEILDKSENKVVIISRRAIPAFVQKNKIFPEYIESII